MTLAITAQDESHFTPDWRASRQLIAALTGILIGQRPQRILEFGPGLSTVLLAKYLVHVAPGARVDVVDHPSEWHNKMRGVVTTTMLDHWMESDVNQHIRFHPVPAHMASGFYDVTTADLGKYDLILIDGPGSSEARGEMYTKGMVHLCSKKLTTFVVDDTHRAPEQELASYLTRISGNREMTVVQDLEYPRTSTIVFPS